MRASSTASATVFVPRIELSRWALAVWLVQHGVAITAIGIAGLSIYVKLAGLLLVIASAFCSRPRRCPRIGVTQGGNWTLPDEALTDLAILPGTQFTRWWVSLRLGRTDTVQRSLRIWRDVLTPRDWRLLLIRLREHRRRSG